MTHIADIEEALDLDDVREIEGAFRALVGFPHEDEIEGAESIETLCSLLDRVAKALRLDQSVMPEPTRRAIDEVMDDPISTSATYADGADVVLAHHEHWRARFLAHAQNGGAP